MKPRRAAPLFTPPPVRKGVWFPLVLGFMLLLAVPGMVFLALSLLGRENAVNGWLKDRFGLTYHFAVPWWAALILFLTPFLILLLYFLKMKRKPLQVPSTYLWKKSIEDLHVNSLFQWMRDNVLLLVQLLIVLLLIYGVMALQVYGAQGSGRHYILMVDSSASMAIADADGGPRLDAAKKAALKEIDAHGDGDVGMVIEFNSNAVIRQPYTIDRDKLRLAVQNVQQTNHATHIDEALNLADSLANPLRSTDDMAVRPDNADPSKARTYVPTEGVAAEVHLYSDGRFPDVPGFAAGSLNINYHRVGAPDDSDNVGIVAFNAQRTDKGASSLRVFLRVLNFRDKEVQTQVKLDEMDWTKEGDLKVIDSHIAPATLPPLKVADVDANQKEVPTRTPGEQDLTFELANIEDTSNRVLRASLVDNKDAFPADDAAWLVVGVVRKARVLIVTDGNAILHDFFDQDATQKVAATTYITPADLKEEAKYLRPAQAGAFDLVVFDRCAPEGVDALPLANTYFIDDVPPPWKRSDMPDLKNAQIRNPTSKDPLMDHLSGLDEIAFFDAFRFELEPDKNPGVPPRVPKLLETEGGGAVLFALPRRSFTDVVQTFPLVNAKGEWTTNWMEKLSFPLFLRNVLYQLGGVSDAAAEGTVQPGGIKAIRPDVAAKDGADPADAGVKEVKVWDQASHTSETLTPGPSKDFLYKDTEDVGVYLATWEGGRRGFAVNLLDENESDVRPREEVKIGAQVLATAPTHGQPSDLWPWAALAALVLLIIEWAMYHFRVFG